MLLAIAPLAVFFVLATASFGALLLGDTIRRRARGGENIEEGELISSTFVGDGYDWAVKVYFSRFGYEAQVLYQGEFQERQTGFPSPEAAETWGARYARERGA